MRLMTAFTLLLVLATPCGAQRTDDRDLLLFGKAWLDPSDYAWSRESETRLEGHSEVGARVKDFGRLRVRFISLEEDLLGLDILVLRYRYEAQLRGGKTTRGISEMEGTRLPSVWLHPALGFSVGSDPKSGLRSGIQAGELFELLDFRGFVPSETPQVGEVWKGKMLRKPDDRFRFREERDRTFTCESVEATEKGEKFKIKFEETLKVTSMEPSRSHEICETEGTYWVLLPMGRVEEASWESVSTEYTSKSGRGGTSDSVETTTRVNLVRRDPPPPRPRRNRNLQEGKAIHEEPPLPPR